MEMRKLTSKDIFPLCSIMQKIGLDEFKSILTAPEIAKALTSKNMKEDILASVGMGVILDVATTVISNLPKCESDLYAFLASLTGKQKSELENLGIAEFTELIIELFKKEEFKDFFTVVSKYLV